MPKLNPLYSYVGEVGIWTGIWGLSTAALAGPLLPTGAVLAAATSPLFTWFLVRNVSGVPPLEVGCLLAGLTESTVLIVQQESGDKKWGSDPKWQEYKRSV